MKVRRSGISGESLTRQKRLVRIWEITNIEIDFIAVLKLPLRVVAPRTQPRFLSQALTVPLTLA